MGQENSEVIAERVSNLCKSFERHIIDCEQQHKSLKADAESQHRELKNDIIGLHKRLDKTLESLRDVVLLDQKVNTVSGHVAILEEKTRDLETVKKDSSEARSALVWVNRIIIGAVLMAIVGVVLVK